MQKTTEQTNILAFRCHQVGARVQPPLLLDTVLAGANFFSGKWTPALKRNQSWEILRFLLCRLYDSGRGNIFAARVTLSQGTLADKVELSSKWVWQLCQRLQDAGWIRYTAPWTAAGMRASCTFAPGRRLKRLLVMLSKAGRKKSPIKSDTNTRWEFLPTDVEKKLASIRQREKEPPSEAVLRKIPLLGRWLERGVASQEVT